LMAERRQAFRHERESAQPLPSGDD
jgi:hypothetical protein